MAASRVPKHSYPFTHVPPVRVLNALDLPEQGRSSAVSSNVNILVTHHSQPGT